MFDGDEGGAKGEEEGEGLEEHPSDLLLVEFWQKFGWHGGVLLVLCRVVHRADASPL